MTIATHPSGLRRYGVVNCSLPYRAAAAAENTNHPFRGDIPRPDAGHFCLGTKVTKNPLKPLQFQPSRHQEYPVFD